MMARVVPDGGVSMATAPLLNLNRELAPVKHGSVYRIHAARGSRVLRWQEMLVPVNAMIPGTSELFPAIPNAMVLTAPTGSPYELFRAFYAGDPAEGVIRLATLDGKQPLLQRHELDCAHLDLSGAGWHVEGHRTCSRLTTRPSTTSSSS